MKVVLLVSAFCLISFLSFGQHSHSSANQLAERSQQFQKFSLKKSSKNVRDLSPQTAFLLMDLQQIESHSKASDLTEEQIIKKYGLVRKSGILYANSFVSVSENFNKSIFKQYGIHPNSSVGHIYTALIPVLKIQSLSDNPDVNFIQIGEKVAPYLDSARAATNVDSVHEGINLPQAYFGEGVIVGIVDVGLDYTHPNFYDSSGISGYRIKRVWEQRDTSGPAPSGYNYGKELTTQTQMLNEKRDLTTYSHATHVAGIALGAGGGQSTQYMGVAPKSNLVFVGTTLYNSAIMDGLTYIYDYADSVGKPSVINLSLGSQVGPHDGTSLFDQMCDSLVGAGKLLVGAAGNDGSKELYLGKTYSGSDTNVLTFMRFPGTSHGTNGKATVDIWGEVGDSFFVSISIYNTQTDIYEDQTQFLYHSNIDSSYDITLTDNDSFFPDDCEIDLASGISPLNDKPHIQLYIDNTDQDDNEKYVLIEIRAKNTHTDMWSYHAAFIDKSYSAPILPGTNDHSVSECGGTGNSIITVGAFTTKKTWDAYSSGLHSVSGTVGEIASFSSRGPTADNRTKPDIAAPGQVLVSSVNSFYPSYNASSIYVVDKVHYGTKDWWYAIMQGTSMAAPMVTGIMALWLEMYPDLTPDQAKYLLKEYAITDGFTGSISSVGSNTWGWGKANAWVNIPSILPSQPVITPDSINICAGTTTTLTAPVGFATYEWNTGDSTQSISVDAAGSYVVMVSDSLGFHSAWSDTAFVTVMPSPMKPTISQHGDTLISSSVSGNQWYRNNNLISGATNQKFIITQSGDYKVVVSNMLGCTKPSDVLNTEPTNISGLVKTSGLYIYPNPVNDVINIQFKRSFNGLTISVYDDIGRLVQSNKITKTKKGNIVTIDLKKLSTGIYSLKCFNQEINKVFKITVIE